LLITPIFVAIVTLLALVICGLLFALLGGEEYQWTQYVFAEIMLCLIIWIAIILSACYALRVQGMTKNSIIFYAGIAHFVGCAFLLMVTGNIVKISFPG
jgi:hypothetical protein